MPNADTEEQYQAQQRKLEQALQKLRQAPKACDVADLDALAKCLVKLGWTVDKNDRGTHILTYSFRCPTASTQGLRGMGVVTINPHKKGDHLDAAYVKAFRKEVERLLEEEG